MILWIRAKKFQLLKKIIFCLNDYDDLKVHYEAFKEQFIKWTISGELPKDLKSHQNFYF